MFLSGFLNDKKANYMENDTVISEISAIQVKLLFLHFKSIKINEDIQRINSISFSDPDSPEAIKKRGEIAYSIIDIIALFESYNSFVRNINNYKNIAKYLNRRLRRKLENIKISTAKWKHVRNKIGGHIDIKPIQEFCDSYSYKGVFISNDLEADFKGILILQMIESAINNTLDKSKLFSKKVILTQESDLGKIIAKINEDWTPCLELFGDVFELLYKIGKKDKLKTISRDDIGLIKF